MICYDLLSFAFFVCFTSRAYFLHAGAGRVVSFRCIWLSVFYFTLLYLRIPQGFFISSPRLTVIPAIPAWHTYAHAYAYACLWLSFTVHSGRLLIFLAAAGSISYSYHS